MKTAEPARRVLLGAMIALGAPAAMAADPLPPPPRASLETILPWTLPRGQWALGTVIGYRADARPPFYGDVDRFRRDEWRASILDATLGLGGGGDVRLRFGLQRFEEEGGERETGIEDARISFTYRIPVRVVAAALHLAVKLPNAPGDHRLGTDATDVFLGAALGGSRPRWGWSADLGLGILGSPGDAGVQDDVLRFGAAGWSALGNRPSPLRVFAEASGQAASRFTNDVRVARVGLLLPGRMPLHAAVRRGLTSVSEPWGVEAGLTLYVGPNRP